MQTVVQRALEGFKDHALAWGRIQQGTSWEHDGIAVTVTGVPIPLMNRIMVFEMPSDPEGALHKTREFIEETKAPYAIEIFDETAAFKAVAEAAGFQAAGFMPFMVHPDSPSASADLPPELEEGIPEDPEQLDAWAKALAAGFGMPESLAAGFAWPEILKADDWRVFTANRGDKAVGTSWACYGNGVTGVFSVSTLPSERRKGVGAALTVAAMRTGALAGDNIAYLEASEMGYPVYEKLGFQTMSNGSLYTLPVTAD